MPALVMLRHLASFIAVSVPVLAQSPFDLSIGSSVATADDSMTNVALSFSFPMPDPTPGGNTVTSVDIDENGRILLPGTDASDFTASVAELLSDPTAVLAPHWGDLDASVNVAAGSGIYFDDDGSRAVVTWVDTAYWSTTSFITFQVQMHSDGRITYCFDSRLLPALTAVVGLSEGNGATDPGGSDLSSGPASPGPTIFEAFGPPNNDLAGLSVEFTPDGFGGYTTVVGPSGTAPTAPTQASVEYYGHPCTTGLLWLTDHPTNPTDYTVVAADPAQYVDPVSAGHFTLLMTADDDIEHVVTPFDVVWPDGSTTPGFDVDSNGRILPPGIAFSDFSPEVSDLLNDPHPTFAPCWIDFDITRPASTGDVYAFSDATSSTVTWLEIAQYDGAIPLTVQATVFANGNFQVIFRSMSPWQSDLSAVLPGGLIGLSSGNGATDPGESDYSSLPALAGGPTIYEFFDGALSEPFDLQVHLRPINHPTLGGAWNVSAEHLPASSTLAALFVGFVTSPLIDLSIVGAPGCVLGVSPVLTLNQVPAGGTAAFGYPIDSSWVGLTTQSQCAALAPGANPLGVVLTNVLVGHVGL